MTEACFYCQCVIVWGDWLICRERLMLDSLQGNSLKWKVPWGGYFQGSLFRASIHHLFDLAASRSYGNYVHHLLLLELRVTRPGQGAERLRIFLPGGMSASLSLTYPPFRRCTGASVTLHDHSWINGPGESGATLLAWIIATEVSYLLLLTHSACMCKSLCLLAPIMLIFLLLQNKWKSWYLLLPIGDVWCTRHKELWPYGDSILPHK